MKMKQKCLFLLLIVFTCIFTLFTSVIKVNAMNTDFTTENLTQEEQHTFISNISISLLTSEPEKKGILCFDVNEQGMIAIAQKGAYSKEVCIYSANGTFLYGYTFKCSQNCAVEWDNERINIYFVRSDVIISLDTEGNVLDIKKVQDTINNNTHRNDLLYSTSQTVGDTTYLIRNDMGIFNWVASSYSQIITIDSAGVECVIYDINSNQFSNMTKSFVSILIFVSIAIVSIIFQIVSGRKRHV